jgi:hypothetical protein
MVTEATLASGQWQELSPASQERSYAPAAWYQGRLYAFGGLTNGSILTDVQLFDTLLRTWQFVSGPPQMLYYGCATTIATRIYLTGIPYVSKNWYTGVAVYDPDRDTYKSGSPLSTPIVLAGTATLGPRICLVGGRKYGSDYSDSVFAQQIESPVANVSDPLNASVSVLFHTNTKGKPGGIIQGFRRPLAVQEFAVDEPTELQMAIEAGDTAHFRSVVRNITDHPIRLQVSRGVWSSPNAPWSNWFCVDSRCGTPHDDTLEAVTVAPGDSLIVYLHFFCPTEGMGKVELRIASGQGPTGELRYSVTSVSAGGVEPRKAPHALLYLFPNRPNPFSGRTDFSYTVTATADCRMDLYTIAGLHVASFDEGTVAAGTHLLHIDGSLLGDGVYLARLTFGSETSSRLVTVMH